MQAHSQQPVWYCCPCAHHADTQSAASTVQYSTVQYCCPCAHHAGTQSAASMVMLSLCTPCRHTASSQYGTAVPVHATQAHSSHRGADPPTLNLNTMNTSCFVTRERATSTNRWTPELVWMQLAASHQLTVRIISPFNILCTVDSLTRTSQAIGWSCTAHVMSHHRGPDSIPGLPVWDLWWTKWQSDTISHHTM